METVIKVDNISMMFNKSSEKVDNIKEFAVKLLKHELMFEEFWALKNISLEIKKGESVGIIGLNGSGKSTLLKVIAKVLKPTRGNIEVCGRVAPLIELGAGFDMDLTARENIFLNGAVLGQGRNAMREKFESIMDFSELWDFVDTPLKNYSSGMIARLGFSIATSAIPDILIVDEVLGVGDFKFQQKCQDKMQEIVESGATILFVSHSITQVEALCKRVIWLERGALRMDGKAKEICPLYMQE